MNDSDKQLVERARRAIEPFQSFPRSWIRAAVEAMVERLERPVEFASTSPNEARHDLRLIAGMGQQWQPIDENTPMDKPVLLGWWETHPEKVWKYEAGIAGHENNLGPQVSNGWLHGQATHWMPLPEAPQKEEV